MAHAAKKKEQPNESGVTGDAPDVLERIASWASAALILALIVYLGWDALHPDTPAELEARVGATRRTRTAYETTVVVTNAGDQAARDVHLRVILEAAGVEPEEGEATLDWVPGHSRREAVVLFNRDPALGTLRAEVRGFQVP